MLIAPFRLSVKFLTASKATPSYYPSPHIPLTEPLNMGTCPPPERSYSPPSLSWHADVIELPQSLPSSAPALSHSKILSVSVASCTPAFQTMHPEHPFFSYCMCPRDLTSEDFAAPAKCTASETPLTSLSHFPPHPIGSRSLSPTTPSFPTQYLPC